MSIIPLPALAGVLDAEIEHLDGVNFAKPRLGLLPVYNFPNYPQPGEVPAVQLNGAWFQVNPVQSGVTNETSSDSSIVSGLKASNISLSAQIQDLQRKLAVTEQSLQREREARAKAEKEAETLRQDLSRSSSLPSASMSPANGINATPRTISLTSLTIGPLSGLTPAKTHSASASTASTATIIPSSPQPATSPSIGRVAAPQQNVTPSTGPQSPVQSRLPISIRSPSGTSSATSTPQGIVAAAVAKGNAAAAASSTPGRPGSNPSSPKLAAAKSSGSSNGLTGLSTPSNAKLPVTRTNSWSLRNAKPSDSLPPAYTPYSGDGSGSSTPATTAVPAGNAHVPGQLNAMLGGGVTGISLADLKVSSSAKVSAAATSSPSSGIPHSTGSEPSMPSPVVNVSNSSDVPSGYSSASSASPVTARSDHSSGSSGAPSLTLMAPLGGISGLKISTSAAASPSTGAGTASTPIHGDEIHIAPASLLASDPGMPLSSKPALSPTSTTKATTSFTDTTDGTDLPEPDMDSSVSDGDSEEDLLEPGEGFGEIWIGAWPFNSTDESDAPFESGDRISIINKRSSDWWVGRVIKTGKAGLFPFNHLAPGPVQ